MMDLGVKALRISYPEVSCTLVCLVSRSFRNCFLEKGHVFFLPTQDANFHVFYAFIVKQNIIVKEIFKM